MSIRRTFLLLIAPLFLLLAGVNGALLYVWERAEAERGLAGQALAAAVTTAAFADASDDLARALSDPVRAEALRDAARRVTGLRGLYIVRPDGRAVQIAGRPSRFWPGRFEAPRAPLAAPIRSGPSGERMATGLAPVAGGGYVIAQIDAEPLFAQVAGLQRLIVGVVLAAGLVGLALALAIARLIVRELARNSATIEAIRADRAAEDGDRFAIRETRDLALAVRLMRASVSGRLARSRHELARRDRERDEAGAVAAYRETAFAPLSLTAAGAAVAVRMLGAAPAGSFHALCGDGRQATLVLGSAPAKRRRPPWRAPLRRGGSSRPNRRQPPASPRARPPSPSSAWLGWLGRPMRRPRPRRWRCWTATAPNGPPPMPREPRVWTPALSSTT